MNRFSLPKCPAKRILIALAELGRPVTWGELHGYGKGMTYISSHEIERGRKILLDDGRIVETVRRERFAAYCSREVERIYVEIAEVPGR